MRVCAADRWCVFVALRAECLPKSNKMKANPRRQLTCSPRHHCEGKDARALVCLDQLLSDLRGVLGLVGVHPRTGAPWSCMNAPYQQETVNGVQTGNCDSEIW